MNPERINKAGLSARSMAVVSFTIFFCIASVPATNFTWDAVAGAGIQGGSGTWGTDAYWTSDGGPPRIAWRGDTNNAIFAGSDGTYTITLTAASTQYADSITFSNSGYTVTGGTALYLTGGKLHGTMFGTAAWFGDANVDYTHAWDANTGTYYDGADATGNYTGIDLGAGNARAVTRVRYWPRAGWAGRMDGGTFQGSNTSSSSGYADLYTISGTPPESWSAATSTDQATAYRYLRYLSPTGGHCNIAEGEFHGLAGMTVASGKTATISSVINGVSGLGFSGGTLTLSGANTYTGATTISTGTLKLQTVAFSTTPRTYSISSGAVLNIDGNTDVATGTTIINGTGTLRFTGGTFAASGDNRDITMSLGSGGMIDVQTGANMRNGTWQDITWTSNLADLNVDGTFDMWDGNTVTVDALTGSGSIPYAGWGDPLLTVGADNGSGTFSGVISSTRLTKSGSGTQTLSGANTYTGVTTISGGTLQIGAGGATGAISNSSNVTDNATLTFNRNNAYAYSGVISGTGAVIQAGSGTTSLLTATNTYSGGTTINAGTIQLGNGTVGTENAAALGTGTVNVNTGGTLYFNPGGTGTTYSFANSFSVNGGTISGEDGVQRLATGVGATFTIGASGATIKSKWTGKDVYIDGIMSGSAAVAFAQAGGGWEIGGIHVTNSANTYSGTITHTSSGLDMYLYLDNITALRYATITLASSGATPYLQLGSANANLTTIVAGLTSAAGVGIVNTNTAAGTYTLNVNNAANNTFGGVLANNATGILALAKTGAGTLTLSGSSTYTGTTTFTAGTISAGTLANGGANSNIGAAASTADKLVFNGGELNYTGGAFVCDRLFTLTTNGGTITSSGSGALEISYSAGYNAPWTISGTGTRTLTLGGTNTGDNGFDAVLANDASSNATSLTKAGAGKWILRAANTYTGTTTISAGTLQISANGTGAAISNSSNVSNSGTLIFYRSNDYSYSGVISGTGAVTKLGAGTVTLSGNSTYTGTTTITTGTLQVGIGGAAGSFGSVSVIDNGTLTVNRSDAISYGGVVSGTGATIQAGTGTLTLTGTNTYSGTTTISAGTLQIGTGGVAGAIVSASIVDNATFIISRSDPITYPGVISGTGAFTQAGPGALTLSNTNTYTGATTVSAGTLLVTGSLAAGSAVGVSSAATLGGTGTVGGAITMNNGSSLAPGTGGTTIGILRTGSVTFNATSTYSVDLNGTTPTFDSIYSTGTVALGAGSAALSVASLSNSANGKVYRIIAATSVTGTFSGKAEASTFAVSGRLLRINYTATKVTLTDVSTGPTPAWSQTSLGTINGGAINEGALYLATGSTDYLYSRSLTDGSQKWSYATGHGACHQPTYFYTGAVYKVLASAVDWVIARQDDGASSSQVFAPLNLAGAGTPYVSYDGASFYVPYTGNLTKRSMADPASGPVTVAVGSISTLADLVVTGDFVFCATTDGYVNRYDAADFTPLTQSTQISGGPSVNLPLVYSMGTLYVTPNNSTVQAFTTSTMGAAKWSMTYSGAATGATNTGPAYIIQSRDTLYTAAGNYVVKVGCISGSGTQKWVYDAGGTVISGPICYGASVYFGRNGGSYYALDDATGIIRANWPYNVATGNATSGPWIDVTNSRVIFGTTGGDLNAFALEP